MITKQRSKCCGCMLCKVVCPVGAITEEFDEKGCRYPKVDETKCISCGKCARICAFHDKNSHPMLHAYAGRRTDEAKLLQSQSGGCFSAVAEAVWADGGIVYGCVLNEHFDAVHKRITRNEDAAGLYGSKYIQSDISNVFKSINEDIRQGKEVLFCGTSCQVAAVRQFIGSSEKLYTIDLLCHGVPGNRVYHDFLHALEKKYRGPVEKMIFRNKKQFGWHTDKASIKIKGQWIHTSKLSTLYDFGLTYRDCCYACPFKTLNHPGDLTIGDCWGTSETTRKYEDNKGLSIILVNTDAGKKLLKKAANKLSCEEINIQEHLQKALREPEKRTWMVSLFWKAYNLYPRMTAFLFYWIRRIQYHF